jgi:hypothetical protein
MERTDKAYLEHLFRWEKEEMKELIIKQRISKAVYDSEYLILDKVIDSLEIQLQEGTK